MIWHPHTDSPGTAETALIAVTRPDAPEPYILGLAEAKHGRWYSEDYGELIEPPFWWADEQELLALIDDSASITSPIASPERT